MNLPEYKELRLRVSKSGQKEVFDIIRHRYVTLTPEEWVRQHFIHYLITEMGYPQGLLANEVEIRVADKKMRCDSVLFSRDRTPQMIIEYKAETVVLTEEVVRQITTYNMLVQVSYLLISNGNVHLCLCYSHEDNRWHVARKIPRYDELSK